MLRARSLSTRPLRSVARRAIVLTAVAVAVAACGGGSEEAAAEDPFEVVFGGPLSATEQRALELQQEERIAECMAQAGFEYTPFDRSVYMSDIDRLSEEPDYRSKHGYGVVLAYELFEWPNTDAEGNLLVSAAPSDVNPNDAYYESLSPDDMEAYSEAMYGPTMPEMTYDEEGSLVQTNVAMEDRGCTGAAYVATFGHSPFDDADFAARYDELRDQTLGDPAVAEAVDAWVDCMRETDAAYDFTSDDEASSFVELALEEAKGLRRIEVDESGIPLGSDEPIEGASYKLGDHYYAFEGQPSRLTKEQIDDLKRVELDLWKADQKCRDDSDLDDIRRRRDEQLTDALKSEFPEYVVDREADD